VEGLTLAPIGKLFPKSGVLPEHTSDYTAFEAPDPMYWTRHGYAIIVADCPGTWYGDGKVTYTSPEEAELFYDLIEWAGVQEWSSGLVGLSGVSYLAVMQVRHLKSELRVVARCRIISSPSWSN
jgi:uncharacterized protein